MTLEIKVREKWQEFHQFDEEQNATTFPTLITFIAIILLSCNYFTFWGWVSNCFITKVVMSWLNVVRTVEENLAISFVENCLFCVDRKTSKINCFISNDMKCKAFISQLFPAIPSYSQLYQCNSKMCSGKLNLKTVHSECTCHFRVQQSMIGSLFWSALVICLQFSLLCNKINACKNNCWSAFHSTEMLKQK